MVGYSCSVVWGKELMDVSLDDAGLARPQISNNEHLIEMLLFAS